MLRKRLLPPLLALLLLLSACGGGAQSTATQNYSAQDILMAMLGAAPEGSEEGLVCYTESDEVSAYLSDYYHLDETSYQDAAVACLSGARAFELAVLGVTTEDSRNAVLDGLHSYVEDRRAAFTGYLPEQAALLDNVIYFDAGDFIILIVSEDPDGVTDALYLYFEVMSNAAGASTDDDSVQILPNGRIAYTAPGIDDMTIYDTTAILSAWAAQDPSSLSDYDRTIYDKASAVLFDLLADNMTDYQREKAIYQWVVTNVSYDYDHYKDRDQLSPDSSTPYGSLVNGKGICLGFATTFQLLMDMADMECITVVGASYYSSEDHAWNQVRLNGEWYCVDSTWDTGIDDPDQWSFFNVTSGRMAATDHQWDYDAVPEATATDHGDPFS
jgi:hypothetical protein